MTVPGYSMGYGQQVVGPDGTPVSSPQPQGSAAEPMMQPMVRMPLGMSPAPTPGAGVVNTLGNTPMTESMTALQQILQQQVSQQTLTTQMLDQMHTSIQSSTKQMSKDFSAMQRHAAEMTAIQTSAIDHILNQIKTELSPAQRQAVTTGVSGSGAGPVPMDGGKLGQAAADAQQTSAIAVPADSPTGGGGPAVGHGRFRTMPQGQKTGSGGGRHELPDGRHAAAELPVPVDAQGNPVDGMGNPIQDDGSTPGAAPASGKAPPSSKTLAQHFSDVGFHGSGVTRMRFRAGRTSFSIPGVARMVAGHAAQKMSDYESSRFNFEYDDQGAISKVLSKKTGEEAGPVEKRLQTTLGYAGRGIADYSKTGSLGGLLGAAEGPLGVGVGAAVFGTKELQSQREKNLFYQQITGGSNASAFGQRAKEAGFAYSNMFTMPGSMARQLYQGVSEVAPGTNTESSAMRSGALDFAVKQYKKTGMDVADSLNLIRTNIDHGVESFSNLNTAIDSVSKTAKAAGENSMEAIKNFSQLYGAVLGNVTSSGATASQISSGLTNTATELGKNLGMSAGNFTGLLSGQGLAMGASSLGMAPNTAESTLAAGGAGATQLTGQLTDAGYSRLYQLMGGEQVTATAESYAKTLNLPNGGKSAGADDQQKVGAYLVQNAGISLDGMIQSAASLQLGNFTASQMQQLIGRLALNGGDIGAGAQLDKAAASAGGEAAAHPTEIQGQTIKTTSQLNAEQAKAQKNNSGGQGSDSSISNQLYDPKAKQDAAIKKAVGGSGKAVNKYVQMVDDTGKRSSLAESLLKDKKSFQNKKFIVQTADGEKQVDYNTLFSQYKDQLKAGTVRDAATSNLLSDEQDIQGDTSTKVTSNSRKAAKGAKNVSGSGDGTVTIQPSDELAQWFKFTASGGATIDQANRNGVPAPPFLSSPSQYPTATGN